MLWKFILNKLCCPVQMLGVRYGQVFCFMVNLIKWVIEITFNWNLAWWYHRSLDKIPFVNYSFIFYIICLSIRVITKLPNTEQSSKGKGKTHKSINRQNQSTTGKLGKPQWRWLGTGIFKEMVGWIRFYGAKPPASITVKRFRLLL